MWVFVSVLWSYGIFSAKGETKPMPILGDLSKMVFKYLLILIPQSPFSPSLTSRPQFLKSQIKKLSLNYLIRDQNVQNPLLLLLHGYGSNAEDLFSFA
jgi:hypothetical protein